MEPILELATRITTHLWYWRGLPPETRLPDKKAKEPETGTAEEKKAAEWKKLARPRNYSSLRNLLDLADIRVETDGGFKDYLWPWNKELDEPPSPPAGSQPEPSTSQPDTTVPPDKSESGGEGAPAHTEKTPGRLARVRGWFRNRYRQWKEPPAQAAGEVPTGGEGGAPHTDERGRSGGWFRKHYDDWMIKPFQEWWQSLEPHRRASERAKPFWDELKKAQEKALEVIWQRRAKIRTFPVFESGMEAGITREELYELVVGILLKISLTDRVKLAEKFLPAEPETQSSRGPGESSTDAKKKFFIQQHLSDCATRSRTRNSVSNASGPIAVDAGTGEDSQAVAKLEAEAWRTKSNQEQLKVLLDPEEFRKLCLNLGAAIPFSMAQRDELDQIAHLRLGRFQEITSRNDPSNCGSSVVACPGSNVEKEDIDSIRRRSGIADPNTTVQKQAFESNLFGVALSGGGIRSATFALGFLEGLADRNILPYIDVLSTVSGGGYIGSWLIAWIKRYGGVRKVQESLRGNASPENALGRAAAPGIPRPEPFGSIRRNADPATDHVRPIRLLREYARYLAPEAGLLSADTWTIATTWLRNTLLNFLILGAALGALLLLPRIAAFLLIHRHFGASLPGFPNWLLNSTVPLPAWVSAALSWLPAWAMLALSSLMFLLACVRIGRNSLATFGPSCRRVEGADGDDDTEISIRVLPGVLLGGYFYVAFLWSSIDAGMPAWTAGAALGGLVFVGILVLGKWAGNWGSSSLSPTRGFLNLLPSWTKWPLNALLGGALDYPGHLLATMGCAAVAFGLGVGLRSLSGLIALETEKGVWMAAGIGTPLVLGGVSLTIVIFIGLMGTRLSEEEREWWSRMGALLSIALAVWLVLSSISYFAPYAIIRLGLASLAGGGVWGLITGWGSKLAFSPKSGKEGAPEGLLNSTVLTIAPFVFIVGLLALLSFGLFLLVGGLIAWADGTRIQYQGPVSHALCCEPGEWSLKTLLDHYWSLLYGDSIHPFVLLLALCVIALLVARCVDINQFSMHNFYKNRLVRCYLGASRIRAHRHPNAFTGFDLEDDVRLWRFQYDDPSQATDLAIDCQPSYAGPFPVLNTALNVTQGGDLGLQERKAESFFFTPLWSGFDYSRRQATVQEAALRQYGFRQTWEFAEPENQGAAIGTAMAISGAAFNSNAGFHTSPSLAFLLTVFGVRLGWWAGNPRSSRWVDPSPGLGLGCLARELTANTTTNSDFLLLSDGGHFENLGIYELIRRRCRFILAIDAEEDQDFKLEGIGGAIRKCRVDFGVTIDLNVDVLRPLGDPGCSRMHYSIGTIHYPEGACGKIIYVKSSVTGDEPLDIQEFRTRHGEFPHTSTVQQFFDESHFESYRALGHHIAHQVFLHDMDENPVGGVKEVSTAVENLFDRAETDWEARLAALPKEKSNGKDR